jgi:hypothetical protein
LRTTTCCRSARISKAMQARHHNKASIAGKNAQREDRANYPCNTSLNGPAAMNQLGS